MVDRICVASNNKLQIEERDKYENKAEKSTHFVEDAWDHARNNSSATPIFNLRPQ